MVALAAAGALAVLGVPSPTAVQAAPIPRLRIIIPGNPGGGWDQTGRGPGAASLAAGAASEVVCENIGGSVMVGAVALLRPAIDLAPVHPLARLTSDYEVIVVRADSPIRAAKDLSTRLRDNPVGTPVAGGSVGGVDHILAGMLARLAGRTDSLVYQPFAGGAQVVEAVLSGKAAVGISGFSEFAGAVAAGQLRAIGSSSKRSFPRHPSVREQGLDADLTNWRGVSPAARCLPTGKPTCWTRFGSRSRPRPGRRPCNRPTGIRLGNRARISHPSSKSTGI